MALSLYNTLTNKKEIFKPINAGKVGVYSCGPTVYGYIHIGNIRAYLNADILRRYLKYQGYEIRHIKNITDVGHLTADDIAQGDSGEDKLLKKASQEKKSPAEIANFYENYFHQVEAEMNILPANYFPRATAHIEQMIKIIGELIAKNYAYEKNGNVFFDITKFKNYGQLSGNTLENLQIGARLDSHPDKKNPWDFALWLKAPKKHLMQWDSPWGVGYPGWHIECTAMSTEYLGASFDIHTGGEDNIFPHHEAEIAQTECWTGQKFVHYWLHGRHILIDGEKMSKSKKNFYILDDIRKKGFSAMALRLLFLSSHYRSQVNFTWEAMQQAQKNFQKISDFIENVKNCGCKDIITSDTLISIEKYRNKFEKAMGDDLNTPLALSIFYKLISEVNKKIVSDKLSVNEKNDILSFWKKINTVFGLKLSTPIKNKIPAEILKLAKARETARKNKDFQMADNLRIELKEKGYEVKDANNGYEITKIII